VSLVLARIDERLIHGQVVLGWIPRLDADRILIADDALAADAWERDLVASAAPAGIPVEIDTPAAIATRIAAGVPGKALLLLRSPAALVQLLRQGAFLPEVNVGGLHFREGSRRYLDYLYLTPEDVSALKEAAAAGVRLVARDLPGKPAVELNPPLAEGRLDYDHLPLGRP
jgi:mannose/fructose/N-acetylgalactosamine-specific phosphotransferase system component IIB